MSLSNVIADAKFGGGEKEKKKRWGMFTHVRLHEQNGDERERGTEELQSHDCTPRIIFSEISEFTKICKDKLGLG
jgi:hypothetical protein